MSEAEDVASLILYMLLQRHSPRRHLTKGMGRLSEEGKRVHRLARADSTDRTRSAA